MFLKKIEFLQSNSKILLFGHFSCDIFNLMFLGTEALVAKYLENSEKKMFRDSTGKTFLILFWQLSLASLLQISSC